jgi:hypothetical protein
MNAPTPLAPPAQIASASLQPLVAPRAAHKAAPPAMADRKPVPTATSKISRVLVVSSGVSCGSLPGPDVATGVSFRCAVLILGGATRLQGRPSEVLVPISLPRRRRGSLRLVRFAGAATLDHPRRALQSSPPAASRGAAGTVPLVRLAGQLWQAAVTPCSYRAPSLSFVIANGEHLVGRRVWRPGRRQ